jgi:hypothetical protein
MRIGKVDITFTDIDNVNKRQTVILGETGSLATYLASQPIPLRQVFGNSGYDIHNT